MSIASRRRAYIKHYQRGYENFDDFCASQRRDIAPYFATPEAAASRAQMERAHEDGVPYDLDHFPLVTQPEPTDL